MGTLLVGCQHSGEVKEEAANNAPHLFSFIHSQEKQYFQTGCRAFDSDFKLALNYPGALCIFGADGSVVISLPGKLQKFDAQNRLLWTLPLEVNHQLKISGDGQSYLAISSLYKRVHNNLVRSDDLNVISKNGKKLKHFSFSSRTDLKAPQPAPNGWTADGLADVSTEESHVNSFSEIRDQDQPKQPLIGYVAANTFPSSIVIFDKALKPIRKISLKKSKVHDVQQYREKDLIFYTNYLDPKVHESFVGYIPGNEDIITPLFPGTGRIFYTPSCGNLQQLGSNILFIFHNNCEKKPAGREKTATIEFFDPANGFHDYYSVPKELNISDLRLIELKDFFQNNTSH
jgi:hypothetical protein